MRRSEIRVGGCSSRATIASSPGLAIYIDIWCQICSSLTSIHKEKRKKDEQAELEETRPVNGMVSSAVPWKLMIGTGRPGLQPFIG